MYFKRAGSLVGPLELTGRRSGTPKPRETGYAASVSTHSALCYALHAEAKGWTKEAVFQTLSPRPSERSTGFGVVRLLRTAAGETERQSEG